MRLAVTLIATFLSVAWLSGTGIVYAGDSSSVSLESPASEDGTDKKESALVRLAQRSQEVLPVRDSQKPLEEIIVTAQKKTENLQDVPVPVTVLDASVLAERDQPRIQDYFMTVPGLSLAGSASNGEGGNQALSIRGVTTSSFENPTVAVTIDDVPYGSSSILGNGSSLYPDIDPTDLARIEVLRGPQGTLYGASSLGGLIKFVTKDPSTERFSGSVQLLSDYVEHGELGYGVRGAINIPVTDTFAIRASGFTRRDPGYIDNVLTGQSDVNRVDVYGGYLAALWRPSDTISLKLTARYQNTDGDGTSTVDANSFLQPTSGDLRQTRLRGTEAYNLRIELYTATLAIKLGAVDFTSISGYGVNRDYALQDITACCAAFFIQPFAPGFGAGAGNTFETKKYTQEFRLASSGSDELEWLAGAFYSHEYTPADQYIQAINPATGAQGLVVEDFYFPSTAAEYAVFGDLTVHFTNNFDIQFGARDTENRQTYMQTDTGVATLEAYGVPSPEVNPTERTTGHAFSYLVTPRYKISPDLMAYARFTSGYRLGGPNINANLGHVPVSYSPDETYNYELGIKGDLLERTLSFDASAYYIDWKRIQISLYDAATFSSYTANGRDAKSQGLEISMQSRPARGLRIVATASVNDAELTQDLPANSNIHGDAGDRLPYSSHFAGSLSADQDIAVVSNWTGFIGGSFSYIGDREAEFAPAPCPCVRIRLPAFSQLDLRVGARREAWTANLFVNNVADKRGIVGATTTMAEAAPYDVTYIQPRTVGFSVAKTF